MKVSRNLISPYPFRMTISIFFVTTMNLANIRQGQGQSTEGETGGSSLKVDILSFSWR